MRNSANYCYYYEYLCYRYNPNPVDETYGHTVDYSYRLTFSRSCHSDAGPTRRN